ncbi:MAG: DUF4157 domain-containing protein [Bacteroidota bacterium]
MFQSGRKSDNNSSARRLSHALIQTKLEIGRLDDEYEKEANDVADQVMRISDPSNQVQMKGYAAAPNISMKCAKCEEEEMLQMKPSIRKLSEGNMQYTDNSLTQKLNSTKGRGKTLPEHVGHEMGSKIGANFSNVKVHTDASAIQMNQELGAKAFTHGRDVYFNQGQYNPSSSRGKRLLAHELTHVVQQTYKNDQINKQEDKTESPLVKSSKKRLAVMKRYRDILMASDLRKTRITSLNSQLLKERTEMDNTGIDPFGPLDLRQKQERKNIKSLNRRALRIELKSDSVIFNVKFHVRFEGATKKASAANFKKLVKNFQTGVDMVWNHKISLLAPMAGKKFNVVPEFVHIDQNDPRDQNFWLITVRPTNLGALIYNDQPMGGGTGIGGLPTSVTDSNVDGGVMSIPPSHITNPGVLGHELLHLFGLVDRYLTQTVMTPKGEVRGVATTPTRGNLNGRKDPLGSEESTILREDVNFLFHHLGVYAAENTRDRNEAQRATSGMSLPMVLEEIHRLEGIIRTGRDSSSLIEIRKDFNDKISDSVNDL